MKKKIIYLLSLTVLLAMGACTYDVGIHTPGGAPGEAGFSAYDLWKSQLQAGTIQGWPKENNTIADYFKYKKGKDGANGTNGTNGKDGANGQSAYDQWKELVETGNVDNPHKGGEKWDKAKNSPADFFDFLTGSSGEGGQVPRIGDNGNWWIGNDDLGVPAKGEKGAPGRAAEPPVVTIENGFWVINGKPTTTKAIGANGEDGADGVIPSVKVTDDGYWEIGGVKSSTKARGTDGNVPEVSISADNTWVIGGVDTKKSVFGPKGNPGRDGENGASAYELWKDYIKDGNAPNPHKPGEKWPKENNEESHFWLYMKGYKQFLKEKDVYTIVPLFLSGSNREYVHPHDGTVDFEVLDKEGNLVPAGVTIMPLKGTTFNEGDVKTDAKGRFKLKPDQLPDNLQLDQRTGPGAVKLADGTEEKTADVMVPNRINFRVSIDRINLYPGSGTHGDPQGGIRVLLLQERQVDGVWEKIPEKISMAAPKGKIVPKGKEDSFTFDDLIEPSQATYAEYKISSLTGAVKQIDPRGGNFEEVSYISYTRPLIDELEPGMGTPVATASAFRVNLRSAMDEGEPVEPVEPVEPAPEPEEPAEPAQPDPDRPEGTYFAVYVGDNEGPLNDYGTTAFIDKAIYLAPQRRSVRPTPGDGKEFESARLEIKDNKAYLWGEVDITRLPKYYTSTIRPVDWNTSDFSPTAEVDVTSPTNYELKGNRWVPIGGLQDYTTLLNGDHVLWIRSKLNMYGVRADFDDGFFLKNHVNNKVRFRIEVMFTDRRYGCELFFCIRYARQNPKTQKYVFFGSGEYVTAQTMQVMRDANQSYSLVYYNLKTTQSRSLKVQDMPADYLTNPATTMDATATPAPGSN